MAACTAAPADLVPHLRGNLKATRVSEYLELGGMKQDFLFDLKHGHVWVAADGRREVPVLTLGPERGCSDESRTGRTEVMIVQRGQGSGKRTMAEPAVAPSKGTGS